MLDMVFGVMGAWNQGILGFGGLIMLAIGAVILADFFYVRLKGVRVDGEISAVRVKGYRDISASDPAAVERKEALEPRKTGTGKSENKASTLLLIVPIIFIGVACFIVFKYAHLNVVGLSANGEIVDIEKRTDSEGGTSKHAVVLYYTQRGERMRAEDSTALSVVKFRRGDDVKVLYDEAKPERFVIDNWQHNLLMPGILGGVGLFALLVMYASIPGMLGRRRKGPVLSDFSKEMYSAVFKYHAPDGQTYEVASDSSSNWLFNKEPGTKVRLLLKPYDYEAARRPSLFWVSFGTCFAAAGLVMLYYAFIVSDVTKYTFLVLSGVVAYGAYRFLKTREGKSREELKDSFRSKQKERKRGRKIGQTLTEDEFKLRLQAYKRAMIFINLTVILMAAALGGGGYYWKLHNDAFRLTALQAEGRVESYVSSYSSSSESHMYYAMIAFETQDGEQIRFKDNAGSSHPMGKEGDVVKVLYQPRDPDEAKVARGTIEDLISMALMFVGGLMIWYVLKTTSQIRRLARKYNIR